MGNPVQVVIDDALIHVTANEDVISHINEMIDPVFIEGGFAEFKANSPSAFALRFALKGHKVKASRDTLEKLKELADRVPMPYATLSTNGANIEMMVPFVKFYYNMMGKIGAWASRSSYYRINVSKLLSVETVNDALDDVGLPRIAFDESVKNLRTDPIQGFDGTLDSLRNVPISELHTVRAFAQTARNKQKSQKTFAEKLEDFGLLNLYDLVMYRPYRFINKSNPDDLYELNNKEPATIIGKVANVGVMNSGKGVTFSIETANGSHVKAQFFRQLWLERRFSKGDEVVVTGKVNFYQGKKSLTGNSIEDAREAITLPIVPVYRQSESRGITTTIILSMVRELLSRAGEIELPVYLPKNDNISLTDAIARVHFPETLQEFYDARDYLALLELTLLQFAIQKESAQSHKMSNVSMSNTEMQKQGIENLPFNLTGAQERGLDDINEVLSSSKSPSVLLTAEVGAGKSLEALLSCLTAVGSGYQATVVAPVETLAKQLYASFQSFLEKMPLDINIEYLSPTMKKREKTQVLQGVADGSIDIVVGTHVLLRNESVTYKNLGLVVVDEQQKFGAEQRSGIMRSRSDGMVPDVIMMTATPIPRSYAQTIYGDVRLVVLDEKPPGRLPIETVWIQKHPNDILDQLANDLYTDIITEAKQGHKTFIFAPLVNDSDFIDAASVKNVYEILQNGALSELRVGMIHGKMKQADQQAVMDGFRGDEVDVLVASTVVEVGIDVPTATRVVILSADRLGASSLHQIRGRVGRSDLASKCYLISDPTNEKSAKRLQSVTDHADGFELAKADMEDRGEGNVLGTEQKGKSGMIFATLASHQKLIPQAREHAQKILKSPYALAALKASALRFELEEDSQRLV